MNINKYFPSLLSDLRSIHAVKLISSMYVWIFIVPVVAQLLSKVNDVATFTIFGYSFEVALELPFSWKVFYFSAMCFALANIIYSIRCPTLIKDHPSYSSFVSEGKPNWHLREYAEEVGIEFQEFKDELKANMELEVNFGEHLSDEEWNQSLFWHVFWSADRKRQIAYYCSLLMYFLGFILIGYVVVQNLYWVMAHTIFQVNA